jgi:hypothetical protein
MSARFALGLAFPLQLILAVAPLAASAQETETIDLFEPSSQRIGAPSNETIPGMRSGAVGAVNVFSISPAARQSLGLTQDGARKLKIRQYRRRLPLASPA